MDTEMITDKLARPTQNKLSYIKIWIQWTSYAKAREVYDGIKK